MPRKPKEESVDLVRALRGKHLAEPPSGVLRRAIALGERLEPRPRALRWLVDLLFDSAMQPVPVGVRGGTSERRLLYKIQDDAETCQLDLRVRQEPSGGAEVVGQLLPPWPGARVEVRAAKLTKAASLGDSGEFLVRGLPVKAERFRLTIRRPDGTTVVIDSVPVPSQREPER